MKRLYYILIAMCFVVINTNSLFAQTEEIILEIDKGGFQSIDEDRAAIRKRLRVQQRKQARYDSMMRAAMIEKERYEGKSEWQIMYYTIENGDTIFLGGQLKPVFKFCKSRNYVTSKQWKQYKRLVYNFKKVYPYALEARRVIHEADSTLAMGDMTEKEREEYIKSYQKKLFAQFEKPMRKLSISQGRLLLKLIDRELGRTSFYIIREYRGRLSAGFWQTVARIFGNDLKKPYDRFGEDRQVEDLVLLYNSGAFEALYYSMFAS